MPSVWDRIDTPFYGERPERTKDDFNLFDKTWSEWDVIPGRPSSGGGRDGYVPGTPDSDPIEEYDWDNDDERDAFIKLRRWDEGAVRAAAEELGYKSVKNYDQVNTINDWLKENYGDLFDDDEEEEEREPYVPTVYEPTELTIKDYTPIETLKIQRSDVTIGSGPQRQYPLKIGGIKPTIGDTPYNQMQINP